MPKTIVITMGDEYPFFMARPTNLAQEAVVVVRRVIRTNEQNHANVMGRATFVKNLRNKHLVKVQEIVEEDENIHIFYENIESKFDWRDPQIITDIYHQLKNLTTYLANIGVKTYLRSSKIGINEKEQLKYYLGIDFEWDNQKDDEFLNLFYQSELKKLFGTDFVNKSNSNAALALQNSHNNQIRDKVSSRDNAHRKVSFATLSSRHDRMANLEREMNMIKNSYEKLSPFRKQSNAGIVSKKILNNAHSESHLKQPYLKGKLQRDKAKLAKKLEDRKFSGDIKNNIMSGKKLEEKQSDIRSQRGAYPTANKLRERYLRENHQEDIETVNSKSRVQELQYQDYMNIKKSQNKYLNDFISVLEDEIPMTTNNSSPDTSKGHNNPTESSKIEENAVCLTTEALRIKTREAILNSRKVINKVKGMPVNFLTY